MTVIYKLNVNIFIVIFNNFDYFSFSSSVY